MLKKTIKYRDYNDVEREEDYYFNISRAELVLMENSRPGGMRNYYERISKARDDVAIMECFKDLLHMAIGVKSDDGKRFIKSEEIARDFEQSEAYSELLMELFSDPEVALDFMAKVMPAGIGEDAAKTARKELDANGLALGSPK